MTPGRRPDSVRSAPSAAAAAAAVAASDGMGRRHNHRRTPSFRTTASESSGGALHSARTVSTLNTEELSLRTGCDDDDADSVAGSTCGRVDSINFKIEQLTSYAADALVAPAAVPPRGSRPPKVPSTPPWGGGPSRPGPAAAWGASPETPRRRRGGPVASEPGTPGRGSAPGTPGRWSAKASPSQPGRQPTAARAESPAQADAASAERELAELRFRMSKVELELDQVRDATTAPKTDEKENIATLRRRLEDAHAQLQEARGEIAEAKGTIAALVQRVDWRASDIPADVQAVAAAVEALAGPRGSRPSSVDSHTPMSEAPRSRSAPVQLTSLVRTSVVPLPCATVTSPLPTARLPVASPGSPAQTARLSLAQSTGSLTPGPPSYVPLCRSVAGKHVPQKAHHAPHAQSAPCIGGTPPPTVRIAGPLHLRAVAEALKADRAAGRGTASPTALTARSTVHHGGGVQVLYRGGQGRGAQPSPRLSAG